MAEDISARVAWALKKALTPKDATATSGRGTATFVRRDESGVGWVRIPGNDFDTPVAGGIVAEAQPGDTVTYNIENNGVTITGNSTSPSVGGRFVGEALSPVRKALSGLGGRVAASVNIAEAAQAVADAINQHFWTDTHGIHVTEVTQEDWDESHTGANVLINSIGQLFRDGLNNLLTLTTQNGARQLAIWDGLGNAATNVLATFGANETHIGKGGEGTVYLANDTFALSATSTPDVEDPDATLNQSIMEVKDSTSTYEHSGRVEVATLKREGGQGYNEVRTKLIAEMREEETFGSTTEMLPLSTASVQLFALADGTSAIDIEADRVTISGHGAYVQTASTSSNVSVASGSDRSLATITVTEPGCYILIGHVNFAANTSGRRVMGITTSQNASLSGSASAPVISQLPVSGGGSTLMTVVDVVTVGYDSTLKRYLTVYQNSGSAISCNASIKAVRVAAPV